MPGRRGKPAGVGPSLRRTNSPGGDSTSSPASCSATLATRSFSALGPTNRTAAPPGATSWSDHSAATGGDASAFSTATPHASTGCSSARPHTTDTFGNSRAQRSRNAHLRRLDSSSVTSRFGRAAANGIPGAPPPEPTSTIGPSKPATMSAARRLSSSSIPLGSPADVSPGVATTASSQRSSRGSLRGDDDVAIGLRALAACGHTREVLQPFVYDFPLHGGHRLELDRASRRDRALRAPHGKRVEAGLAPRPVPGGVHHNWLPLVAVLAPDDRVHEVLNRVDRLTVLADHQPELTAGQRREHRLVVLAKLDAGADADRFENPLEDLADLVGQLAVALVSRRRLSDDRGGIDRRDYASGRVADPEETSFTLGNDLEANGRLVNAGLELLELTQRRPLRLADGLARCFDLKSLCHRRAFFFFFRLTLRGWLGATAGAGAGATSSGGACSRGGVREERRGGGCPLGVNRRVDHPWAAVPRFVVTQKRNR